MNYINSKPFTHLQPIEFGQLFNQNNFTNIELHYDHFLQDEEFAIEAIKSYNFNLGILDGGYCDLCVNDIKNIDKQIDVARKLNIKKIRLFFGRVSEDEFTQEHQENLEHNLEFLADRYPDIELCFETHKGIGTVYQYIYTVFKKLNKPNLKIVFDPINLFMADVDYIHAFETLKPYISHIHLKGIRYPDTLCGFGEGFVHLENFIKIIPDHITLGLEYEGNDNPITELQKSKNYLEELLEGVA